MSMHTESAVCTPTSRCPESTNRLARDPPSAALRRFVTIAVTCAAGAAEARRLTTVERPAAAKTTTGSADVARAKSSRARSSAMNSRINRSPAEASGTPINSTTRLWARLSAPRWPRSCRRVHPNAVRMANSVVRRGTTRG